MEPQPELHTFLFLIYCLFFVNLTLKVPNSQNHSSRAQQSKLQVLGPDETRRRVVAAQCVLTTTEVTSLQVFSYLPFQ